MQITSVRIKRNIEGTGHLLGIATIQLDNCLVIHDIKMFQLKDGKRVISFPNKKIKKYEYNKDNSIVPTYEYSDIVHPSNSEFRKYIQDELYKIYDNDIGGDN